MENSPRGGGRGTGSYPVDFADAVEIAGGEAQLRVRARTEETWRQWKEKDKAVPAHVVVPFLLRWWRARRALIAEARRAEREKIIGELGGTSPGLSGAAHDIE